MDKEINTQNFFQKNSTGILVGVIAVLIVIIMFSFGDKSNTKNEIQTINNTEQIEKQEELIKNQQAAIDLQNKKIAAQEKIERDRKLSELNNELSNAYIKLDEAKTKLNNITGFKLLRSASARNQQIREAQETISIYENEVKIIENKIKKLK